MAIQSIYDLDEKALAALTQEEIKSFIDIECAQKGVVLLPPEPVAPVKPQVKLDATYYEYCGMHFDNPEAAAAIMEEVAKHNQYGYTYIAGNKVFKPDNYYSSQRVSTEKGMQSATYEKHKIELDQYDSDKRTYDAEKILFDKAVKSREGIVYDVNNTIERAKNSLREEKLIRDTWERYTQLAKNDFPVAFDFLKAAKPSLDLEFEHKDLWDELERLAIRPDSCEAA
jgi:hypothetical protein